MLLFNFKQQLINFSVVVLKIILLNKFPDKTKIYLLSVNITVILNYAKPISIFHIIFGTNLKHHLCLVACNHI